MSNNDQDNQPQRISRPVQQARILKQLKDRNCLLTVRIPAVSEARYTSAVIQVDTRKNKIHLDELNPSSGHERLKVGHEVRVDARADGVETRFKSTVERIAKADGIPYYVLPFPETITYHQRRSYHRVPVRMTLQSKIALASEASNISLRLTDMSVGGFGATASTNADLVSGQRYNCTIELEGEKPLHVDIEVRHVQHDMIRKQLHFGALFLNMDPAQRSRVERLVMELEREMIRST